MTLETFPNIIKQVVMDMAYVPGLQINTFFFIDGPPDLATDNIGAEYTDYQSGRFWSRDWVNKGAEINTLRAQYPILFIEQGPITFSDFSDQWFATHYDMMVVDHIDCPDCPKSMFRDTLSISRSTLSMMQMILHEAGTYEQYLLDDNGQERYEWISAGRLATLSATPPYDTATNVGGLHLADNQGGVRLSPWGLTEYRRGWATRVPIEICRPDFGDFNYDHPVTQELATTICPC